MMMHVPQSIDPHIFRAYDIRGKAHAQLTEEACLLIGKAFGSLLCERYHSEHPTVAVGRDMRTHSPALERAVVEGLKSAGCHVFAIGETPSPVSYFTIMHRRLDGSVQVTASHNPKEDNGLKLQIRNAEAFAGDDIQELRRRVETGKFLLGKGSVETIDAITPYLALLKEQFQGVGKGLEVAVDCGNGVTGPVNIAAFKQTGCTVIELFTDPDGTFPNHPADPSKHATLGDLQRTVRERKAAIGFAFDGDGDRLGVVDETGAIRSSDDILLLLARDYLSRNPKKPVIFTVSNSSTLETEIRKWSGEPIMCKVGHSFVEHAMREYEAGLGGEQSGHFFLGEVGYGYDDALVAALQVLVILQKSGKPFSSLFADFPKVYQAHELRPGCPDSEKTRIIRAVTKHFAKDYPVNTLDGARIDFGDGAWAGIRQSNTSPCLSVCIEARSPKKLAAVEGEVLSHLRTYPEIQL